VCTPEGVQIRTIECESIVHAIHPVTALGGLAVVVQQTDRVFDVLMFHNWIANCTSPSDASDASGASDSVPVLKYQHNIG